jgi:RNA polymerase sigma-70 factor (ECF subfamily)
VADTVQSESILQLITQYQRRLFVYIRTLVLQRNDAEEILQEVNLFIWRHMDQFRPGTDFGAWAYKVAYYHVLTYRKKQSREKLRFSETLVQQLAENATDHAERTDRRQEALEGCLEKLGRDDRELIRLRYESGASVQEMAGLLGHKVKAVYRVLSRILNGLLDCVQRTLRAEEAL